MQRDVAASVEMKLPWIFAAKAEAEESAARQKSNRTDDAMCAIALRVEVVKLDHKTIRVVHRSCQNCVHGFMAD